MIDSGVRSIHDQVSRSGWASGYRPLAELSLTTTSPNFSPNCAPQRLRSFLTRNFLYSATTAGTLRVR